MKGKEKIYKVNVRIGIITVTTKDYRLHRRGENLEDIICKKMEDDEYLLKNALYFSDGYIILLDDGTFKGYLTNDHIMGFIQNNSMSLIINVNQNTIYKKPLSGKYEFISDSNEDINHLDKEWFILQGIDQKGIRHYVWITFFEKEYKKERAEMIKKLEEQYKM